MVADGSVIHAYGCSGMWRIAYPETSCPNRYIGWYYWGDTRAGVVCGRVSNLGGIPDNAWKHLLYDLAVADIDVLCRAARWNRLEQVGLSSVSRVSPDC